MRPVAANKDAQAEGAEKCWKLENTRVLHGELSYGGESAWSGENIKDCSKQPFLRSVYRFVTR
ncbi:MAG: hypothetical protein CMM07_15385 [Rhodopirellula sp.]|nr:hypothetical protein [Rhodopirellula sp.]